jgi:hypothetical protein
MTDLLDVLEARTDSDSPKVAEGVVWLTRLLDDAFVVPGTNIRFGLDPLLGLIPGLGDAIGAVLGYVMLQEAKRLGASRWLRTRMMANYAIDGLVGAIPLLGDLFDVGFKAHRKNLRLLEDHVARKRLAGDSEGRIFAKERSESNFRM